MTGEAGVVLVTGPPRAGVTAMVDELRRRMPSYRFVDRRDTDDTDVPAVVVIVVSAVAPLVESDCVLADLATERTAEVIAVVSKIDDHRPWREVLAADRARLVDRGARWEQVPWVGAAAAPRLGAPQVDELVELLDARLRDPTLLERKTLCAWSFRTVQRTRERERLLRTRRLAAAQHLTARRAAVREARLALRRGVRQRCASLRADLLEEAAAARRHQIRTFGVRARERCAQVLAEVDDDISEHTRDLVQGCDVGPATSPSLPDPPLSSRRLEAQLMAVLGAGFGLGVTVVVTRLMAGLAPQLAVTGLLAGGAAGLITTAWVIRARALLHARAVLQAWVTDAVGALRAAADERVAVRMLAVETAMAASASDGTIEDTEIGRRNQAPDGRGRGRFRGVHEQAGARIDEQKHVTDR